MLTSLYTTYIITELFDSRNNTPDLRLTVVYITLKPFIETPHISHQLPLLIDSSQLCKTIFLKYDFQTLILFGMQGNANPQDLHERIKQWR